MAHMTSATMRTGGGVAERRMDVISSFFIPPPRPPEYTILPSAPISEHRLEQSPRGRDRRKGSVCRNVVMTSWFLSCVPAQRHHDHDRAWLRNARAFSLKRALIKPTTAIANVHNLTQGEESQQQKLKPSSTPSSPRKNARHASAARAASSQSGSIFSSSAYVDI